MFTEIVSTRVPNSNPQPLDERIQEAHRNAQNIINWITVPGVGQRYDLDVEFLVLMFTVLIHSTSPMESVDDIELLIDYVRDTVGQVCNG